jgi:MFS family permease
MLQLGRTTMSEFCEQTPLEQRGSTAMLLLPLQGLASGLFFLTYCIMQLPSNICCMLLGVQKWLTVIMFTWGLVAALFAAVQHPWQFYLLRLLLGMAEAGTFPGM